AHGAPDIRERPGNGHGRAVAWRAWQGYQFGGARVPGYGDNDGLEPGLRQAIGKWRDSLVNLTGTNRLLNLKPSKAGMLVIARPAPGEVLTRVRDGNGYGFRALKADPAPVAEDTDAENAENKDAPEDGPQFPPSPDHLDVDRTRDDLGRIVRGLY